MAWHTAESIGLRVTDEMLLETTDDTGTGEIDTDVLEACIDAAAGKVKGYLAQLYPTECTAETSDPIVEECVLAFTVGNLYLRRPSIGMPLAWANKIDRCYTRMNDIKNGDFIPPSWGDSSVQRVIVGRHKFPEARTIVEFESEEELIDL